MTILVTGAAGFIGFHVTRALLARGERIVALDNMNSYYDVALKEARLANLAAAASDGQLFFHRVDIADMAALKAALKGEKLAGIVHLAAQAGVRHSLDAPLDYVSSNLVGHAHMLEIARASKTLRHMVYASSSSIYGGRERLPFLEDDKADQPVSLYAATKKSAELMSESYAHLYAIPMTGLRFFTVYGPWGRPDMAYFKFTRAIVEGRPIEVYNEGDMGRDFTYIDDIVAGVLAALDHPPAASEAPHPGGSRAPHAVYNLGNNRPERLGVLIAVLEDLLGKSAQKQPRPMPAGDMKETYADISAAGRAFDYAPKTGLRQGLSAFVDWYKTFYTI